MVKYSEVHTAGAPAMALKMAGKPPVIPVGYDLMIEAFLDLSTERPMAEGAVLRIPIMKIIEYLEWHGMDNIRTLLGYIQRMDTHFVKLQQENINRKMKAASAKG